MKLLEAQRLADRIAEELQPLCTRLEIAGSIRRQCGEVNDIDLVLIPSDPGALRDRVLRKSTVIQDGPQNLLVRMQNGFQLDIFIARPARADLFTTTPSNFGSLLLCRTGSKEHNIKLASRARARGLQWKIYEGIFNGPNLVASATEQDLFAALEMDYIEPKDRI